MQKALQNLKDDICKLSETPEIEEKRWLGIAKQTTVLLMAGGESSRLQSITAGTSTNKNSFTLPNGDTMIEMGLRMYVEAGVTDFVALLYHEGESVEKVLGDGSKFGATIRYSYDPGKPVGKGGAVKQAFASGSVGDDRYIIVHNPDDLILDFEGSFPRHILSGHLANEDQKALASVVVVEGTPYPYTGMKVENNLVTEIEMYPIIPIPTHIGVTVFSPGLKNTFMSNFDYNVKSDFEKVLFPKFSAIGQLGAVGIPAANWLPVNTPKAYKELLKRLGL